MSRAIQIDRFTSLDEVKGRDRANPEIVLRAIMSNGGRFSVFDASDDRMASTLTLLAHGSGWVTWKENVGFPWTIFELTPAGEAALAPTSSKGEGE